MFNLCIFTMNYKIKIMSVLRLKDLLKEKEVTGKELAATVGVTENAISMIINNKRQPRFELLLQIAETLNVDIRDLFKPSKDTKNETIYVNREGGFIPVGSLKIT